MRKWTSRAGFIPVVAALALASSACDLEVLNPGSIQDADLNTAELMPILVAGVSAEYNDIQDSYAFDTAILADDMAGTGSYSSTQVIRSGLFDDLDSQGHWEQTHEAAWSAEQAWDRLVEVLGDAGANSSPDAARLYVLMGHAYNRMGENFCNAVFEVGPLEPRTAAFDRAITSFQTAITIAAAAGASADQWDMSARGGIAQAYVGKGDWANAVTWANQVPTDFHDDAIYHAQANVNVIWTETHGRAEYGVWSSLAMRLGAGADGDVATTADNDPRTPYTICGAWVDPDPVNPDPAAGVTDLGCTSGSGAHQGADGLTAHYRQDKYMERGSDIPRVSGVEMRLIEAEAFLVANDFTNFNAKITELRAFYGLGPHPVQPTTAGALDWPYANPADDAWSVLDEERYATLWLTGKRFFDVDRWNHPFLDGGFLAQNVPGANSIARRVSCMPMARNECQLNPNLAGDPACG